MNELLEQLKTEWTDKETRQVYCDEFLNASIATQIKVLREQRGLTQAQLAALAGMMQPRIAALEDVNYSSWTVNVLRRLAEAFDLALTLEFDSFGEKLRDIESFSGETLQRPSFEQDPVFQVGAFSAAAIGPHHSAQIVSLGLPSLTDALAQSDAAEENTPGRLFEKERLKADRNREVSRSRGESHADLGRMPPTQGMANMMRAGRL